MRYPKDPRIENNFDTSVIFFVENLLLFAETFSRSYEFLNKNGIEIVLYINSPVDEAAILQHIERWPFVNWKMLSHSTGEKIDHPKFQAMNECINHATKKYILLVNSPSVKFQTDLIYELRCAIEHYNDSFVVEATFGKDSCEGMGEFLQCQRTIVLKSTFDYVGGFAAFFDDALAFGNLWAKLQYAGLRKMTLLSPPHHENPEGIYSGHNGIKNLRKILFPGKKEFLNNKRSLDCKILYDYTNNKYARHLCERYLSGFVKYRICREDAFDLKRDIVVLLQTYNERTNVNDMLSNVAQYCDGIILLDDSSTDGTYDLAHSDKLLLKAQKTRTGFNDLENRNILLDIASFINARWFVFIDADERFDARFCNLRNLVSAYPQVDTVCFWVANLWDDDKFYKPMSDFDKNDSRGLWKRLRMFKNIGHTQISHPNQKLHFTCVPYVGKTIVGDILLLHHGTLHAADRNSKFEFYTSEDENWEMNRNLNYEFLLKQENAVRSVATIELPPPFKIIESYA